MSNVILGAKPAGQASTRFFTFCARVLEPSKRHASSYRRSRSRLNVKPDASFLPSKTEAHDHIIFNPPPSMPNVYHTPAIFLPKTDKRRQLQTKLALTNTPNISNPLSKRDSDGGVPPLVANTYEKKYNVTAEQVAEIKALRLEDPMQWTAMRLAKKYDCTDKFISYVIRGLSPGKVAQQRLVKEVIKSRWGAKRRIAREDRAIRKERYLRDE